MKILKLILILLLLSSGNAIAATYYCTPSGSGTSSGADWTNACAFNNTTPVRGNTYYLAGGSYSGKSWGAISGTSLITLKKATTVDHGTETGWVASYGTNQAEFGSSGGYGFDIQTSYLLIDGQVGGGPDNWETGLGFKVHKVRFQNASNITIRHADISADRTGPTTDCNNARPVYTNNVSSLTFAYCYVHNAADDMWTVVGSTSNILVEYCKWAYSYQNASCHPDLAQGYGGSYSSFVWRYNYIYALKVTYLWGVHDNFTANGYEIYGNIIEFTSPSVFDSSTSDGVVGDLNAAGTINNLKFYNNTIYGYWLANIGFGTVGIRGSNNLAYNNIWMRSGGSGSGSISSVTHAYNSNYGGATFPGETNKAGDPFIDSAEHNFRLSAATDSGQAMSSPYNVDMYGNIRGADGITDRGAIEYTGAGPTYYTVTPSAGANGSINPSTPQSILSGSTTSFTITANAGYSTSVGGTCGGNLVGTTYTTNAITSSCTVVATFIASGPWVVTTFYGDGGMLSCNSPVINGNTTTCTTFPSSGYYTSSISGCGGTWTSGNSYTTGSITANCTVSATFGVLSPPSETRTIQNLTSGGNITIGTGRTITEIQ